MPELLRSIPFPEDMTHALVAGHGPKGELLEAAIACERGNAPADDLALFHTEALAWATGASGELFDDTPVAVQA
jgi:hypothetical protein